MLALLTDLRYDQFCLCFVFTVSHRRNFVIEFVLVFLTLLVTCYFGRTENYQNDRIP